MSLPTSQSKRPKRLFIALAALLCIGVLMGTLVSRAIYGRGTLHVWARSLYREVKTVGLQRAYADQTPQYRADEPLVIYSDALGPGWADWSWAERDLAAKTPVCRGKQALAMTPVGFKGIYLNHAVLGTAGYGTLQLFVHGGALLDVCIVDAAGKFGKKLRLNSYLKEHKDLPAGWKMARVPLADLGLPKLGGSLTGVVIQAATENAQPKVFFDEITLQPDETLPPTPTELTVEITVDVTADRHSISPYIYGMSFAPKEYLPELRLGLNRWGGNDKSRYNWVHGNASNAARDWRWANRTAWWHASPAPQLTPGPSSAADKFIGDNRAHEVETLITIPTIGWVAKNSDTNTTSVNVPAEGGAPLTTADGAIAGYDPSENRRRTSVPSFARKGRPFSDRPTLAEGAVYQDEWVHHLVKTFGNASRTGVRFYAMDNEPDLWDGTHTDIHPARMGYDDLLAKFLEYGTAVKDVDPTAQVTGPVSWGWTNYLYSPLDKGDDGYRTHADRKRHGNEPFLLWFLKQVRSHDTRAGRRTLDVLDIHYYPQGHGLYTGSVDPDAQARRLRATRSLWDPDYVDESWIAEPVRLIPRLKEWINTGYPGTKIGISEWNFGAETHINGALAVADVLGIFGREDVYFANFWAHPPKGSPTYLVFKLFRNADGNGRGFGDLSCRAVSGSPRQVSSFAAVDTGTNDLTLILVNKMPKATVTAPIRLKGWTPGAGQARAWCLCATRSTALDPMPVTEIRKDGVTLSLPPYSVVLVRIPAAK